MINIIDFNPVDVTTQSETGIVKTEEINPANIYKIRLKTIVARKGGSGGTEVLPRLNIERILVTGIDKNNRQRSFPLYRSNHPLGLFEMDFGEILTKVRLTIKFDSDFSIPLSSGNNPFSFIIEANETELDSEIPYVINRVAASTQIQSTPSIVKAVSFTNFADSVGPISVAVYDMSDRDGGATVIKIIEIGFAELFIGSFTHFTVSAVSGVAGDHYYSATGVRI